MGRQKIFDQTIAGISYISICNFGFLMLFPITWTYLI
jgi:hypothetical protein